MVIVKIKNVVWVFFIRFVRIFDIFKWDSFLTTDYQNLPPKIPLKSSHFPTEYFKKMSYHKKKQEKRIEIIKKSSNFSSLIVGRIEVVPVVMVHTFFAQIQHH